MFSSILRRLIIYFTLLMLVASCGEPVPVDCTPDEEQCTTETEGGFETGTVAGIAAGGAAVVALAAGGLSSDDGGSGSSGGSSSSTNNDGSASNSSPILTGTLIDSAVSGVSYQSTSNLSGLTSSNGRFEYRSGDQVTFQIGDTILGTVTGGTVITPVKLAGVSNTADRRVINIARLLQSLDEDQDPSNGISINATTRAAMLGSSISFDVPISSFSANENTVLAVTGNSLVASNDAINHLHGSLVEEGRPGSVATETAIQQLVPSFVAETSGGQKGATGQSCNFAGGTVPDGGNVIAYQSESVETGSTCSSQTRFCNKGQLSGSYTYTNCQVEEATDCHFNGNSIADGVSTTAYQTATAPFGSTCTSQTRTCSNGTLSGSYTFSKCVEADPLDCNFNGSAVDHGNFVTSYLSDSVAAGGSCSSQTRTCVNGILSGSYQFNSCSVGESLAPIGATGGITAFTAGLVNGNQAYQTSVEEYSTRYFKFTATSPNKYTIRFSSEESLRSFKIYEGIGNEVYSRSYTESEAHIVEYFSGDVIIAFETNINYQTGTQYVDIGFEVELK